MGRKLAVMLLILLMLLLVMPLGIGMVMAPCPECDAGTPMNAIAACVTILLASVLFLPWVAHGYRIDLHRPRALLLVRDLDPPPRHA